VRIEQQIVAAWAERISEQILKDAIADLEGMSSDSMEMLSGDSGLDNVWEEICVQVQDERSFFWNFYVETMESVLGGHVGMLDNDSRLALWTSTDAGWDYVYDHREEDGAAEFAPVSSEDIVAKLMERLLSKAADYENARIGEFLDRHEYGNDDFEDGETDDEDDAPSSAEAEDRCFDLRASVRDPILFVISREQIERFDIGESIDFLRSLLPPDPPDAVWKLKGRISLVVSGYDGDPRELFEIPEVCRYLKALDDLWPYWFFFFSQADESLMVLAMCLASAIEVDPGRAYVDPEDLSRFLERGLSAVNRIFDTYGFPPSENSELSTGVLRIFSNGSGLGSE
jgi:hypothetical protein